MKEAVKARVFHVYSGDLSVDVEADNPEDAAVKAIQTRQWKALGLIMCIIEKGDRESDRNQDCFFGTIEALERAGFECTKYKRKTPGGSNA